MLGFFLTIYCLSIRGRFPNLYPNCITHWTVNTKSILWNTSKNLISCTKGKIKKFFHTYFLLHRTSKSFWHLLKKYHDLLKCVVLLLFHGVLKSFLFFFFSFFYKEYSLKNSNLYTQWRPKICQKKPKSWN